ncbi:MAG: B12-binding domain-containing radical SAM protein [Promethearchaeota archaeon]
MRILIVDCLAIGKKVRKFSRDFIGGGPRLIAAVLDKIEEKKLNIDIIRAEDILTGSDKKRFLKNYDFFLISAMTMDEYSVQNVVDIIRVNKKKALIIIGGPIASDDNLLKKISADISVKGEGERKIYSIASILIENKLKLDEHSIKNLKDVKGINIRREQQVIQTEDAPCLSRKEYDFFINSNLYFDYIKQYKDFKFTKIYVECLRGCSNYLRTKFQLKTSNKCSEKCQNCNEKTPNPSLNCPSKIPPGCGFCSTIDSFGFPKSRDMNNISEEIKFLLSIGAKRIVLGGPDFLDYKREDLIKNKILTTPLAPPEPNYEALEGLIDELVRYEAIQKHKSQIFIENIKASLCTPRALKIIAKIPNSIFSIGCETGSEEFSKLLGRPFNPSKTFVAVKEAIKLGIRVHVYFIHSLPGEKVSYIKDSMDLINKFYDIGVEKITIYKYQEFPGAPFYLLKNKVKMLDKKNLELNKFRKKMVRRVINFNRMRKEEMVGTNINVILAEPDLSNKLNAIGYIIRGGPKVLVRNGYKNLGREVVVSIKKVLSDKLIEGDVVKKIH